MAYKGEGVFVVQVAIVLNVYGRMYMPKMYLSKLYDPIVNEYFVDQVLICEVTDYQKLINIS